MLSSAMIKATITRTRTTARWYGRFATAFATTVDCNELRLRSIATSGGALGDHLASAVKRVECKLTIEPHKDFQLIAKAMSDPCFV